MSNSSNCVACINLTPQIAKNTKPSNMLLPYLLHLSSLPTPSARPPEKSQKRKRWKIGTHVLLYCMYIPAPSRPSEFTCIMHDLIRTECQASPTGLQAAVFAPSDIPTALRIQFSWPFFSFLFVRTRNICAKRAFSDTLHLSSKFPGPRQTSSIIHDTSGSCSLYILTQIKLVAR